jgi:hypothetical protein
MLQKINNELSKIIDGRGKKKEINGDMNTNDISEGECNQLTKVFCTDAN